MKKVLLLMVLFAIGVGVGGVLRDSQVQAKLSDVTINSSVVTPTGNSLGNTGGGSCG